MIIYHEFANHCIVANDLPPHSDVVEICAVHNGKPVTAIHANAFRGSPVKHIKLPESILAIGASAFEDCDHLTMVSTGDKNGVVGAAVIEERAFANSKLEGAITFSNTKVEIGKYAFQDTLLDHVYFPANAEIKLEKGAFFHATKLKTVLCREGKLKSIPADCFAFCYKLFSVVTPQCESVGRHSFFNCESLLALPSKKLKRIGEDAFYGCTILEKSKFIPEIDPDLGRKNDKKFTGLQGYQLRTQAEFEDYFSRRGHTLPVWVQNAVRRELSILDQKGSDDVTRHALAALDILLNTPWEDPIWDDLPEIRTVEKLLNDQFDGLDDVKEWFLEYLSVFRRTKKLPRNNHLLLVGPPGTDLWSSRIRQVCEGKVPDSFDAGS